MSEKVYGMFLHHLFNKILYTYPFPSSKTNIHLLDHTNIFFVQNYQVKIKQKEINSININIYLLLENLQAVQYLLQEPVEELAKQLL